MKQSFPISNERTTFSSTGVTTSTSSSSSSTLASFIKNRANADALADALALAFALPLAFAFGTPSLTCSFQRAAAGCDATSRDKVAMQNTRRTCRQEY